MQVGEELYIYHEKQDAGLCAVHCLNALLQGPYFTEIDLMTIAKEMDEKERNLMMERGIDAKEYLKFMAEDSGNLADDGNYSIQVISKALAVWGLTAEAITSPECKNIKENPLLGHAYICNLQNHWFTVRKLGGDWYNLNSLKSEPEYLSDFYLSLFLATVESKNYTIFVIKGELPFVHCDPGALSDPAWKRAKKGSGQQKRQRSDSHEDEELEAAMQASELEAAIAMSLQQPKPNVQNKEDEDAELQYALQLSMASTSSPETADEPPSGVNVSEISFQMPDGTKLKRRFVRWSKVQSILDFLATKGIPPQQCVLVSTSPKKEYQDLLKATVEEAGLYPTMELIVQKK